MLAPRLESPLQSVAGERNVVEGALDLPASDARSDCGGGSGRGRDPGNARESLSLTALCWETGRAEPASARAVGDFGAGDVLADLSSCCRAYACRARSLDCSEGDIPRFGAASLRNSCRCCGCEACFLPPAPASASAHARACDFGEPSNAGSCARGNPHKLRSSAIWLASCCCCAGSAARLSAGAESIGCT